MQCGVVGSVNVFHASELDPVARQGQRFSGMHDLLDIDPGGAGRGDANHQYGDAHMSERHAVGGGRQTSDAPPQASGAACRTQTRQPLAHRSRREKRRETVPGQRHGDGVSLQHAGQHHRADGADRGKPHPVQHAREIRSLPGDGRPHRSEHDGRNCNWQKDGVVVRRAHADRWTAGNLHEDRIQRPKEYGCRSCTEEHVVQQEGSLPTHGLEQTFGPDARGPDGEERKRATGNRRKEGQDEEAAGGVAGERVHGCNGARADKERAQQGKGEAGDAEKQRPGLQRVPLFRDPERVQECGGDQPWNERGVFHRIPEPPAAPAELVVGPPASQRDAGGQETPGEEHPGASELRPRGVDLLAKQAGNGKRERDGQADVAHVEAGRVKRQAGVLENRIEAHAFDGNRNQACKRVGGEDRERQEPSGDETLYGEGPRTERWRDLATEHGQCRAVDCENQHPQDKGALVVSPHPADLVDQGLERM